MALSLYGIKTLPVRAQAEIWAAIEDELLLDLDLGIGFDITETDRVRIEGAMRLERAGIVAVTALGPSLSAGVKVSRVAPIRATRKVA